MKLKSLIQLLVLIFFLSWSTELIADDFAQNLLGPGFTYSAKHSEQSVGSANVGQSLVFMSIPGAKTQVGVYQYKGSIEQAIASIPIPSDADVTETSQQYAAASLGMFLQLSKEIKGLSLSNSWRSKAESKLKEWGSLQYSSYRIVRGADMDEDVVKVGDKVEILSIECQSPFVDYSNLTIVPGTWVIVSKTSFVISAELLASDEEDDYGWGDEDEGEGSMDPGIPIIPGSREVDVEGTVPYDFGNMNYLVEKPLADVKKFYLNVSGKHCYVDDEYEMLFDEKFYPAVIIYCLDSPGEIEPGDNVIAITISVAPKEILSDLLGRNQGTWTLVSISSWLEEDNLSHLFDFKHTKVQ